MNEGWVRSNLQIGELLKVPSIVFVDPKAVERLKGVYYVGETKAGIMLDCHFAPTSITREPDKKHYRRMINWASIWAGHIKIYRSDGTMVRAQREKREIMVKEVENASTES